MISQLFRTIRKFFSNINSSEESMPSSYASRNGRIEIPFFNYFPLTSRSIAYGVSLDQNLDSYYLIFPSRKILA